MRKSIIILNYGLHIAGVSRALINLANFLVANNYDVTIKLASNNFTLAEELDKRVKVSVFLDGFGGCKLPEKVYGKLMQLIELLPTKMQYRIIVRHHYDVEIAFNRGAAVKLISASTNKRSKKFAWIHTDYMKNGNALAGFKDEADAFQGYSRFDNVLCVSEYVKKSFIQRIGDTGNLITRFNVIDDSRIRLLAEQPTIQKDKFTIIAVGRICEAKNYTLLLDVAQDLDHRGLDCDFWIVGDGELHDQLVDYSRKHQINNVHFLGMKSNPYPYIQAADLYLSTSIYEGLSTTTIEALILGKAVVVTDCAGMQEIVGANDEYGCLVSFNKTDIADTIEKLILHPTIRTEYERQAIERSKIFIGDNCFKEIESLF